MERKKIDSRVQDPFSKNTQDPAGDGAKRWRLIIPDTTDMHKEIKKLRDDMKEEKTQPHITASIHVDEKNKRIQMCYMAQCWYSGEVVPPNGL